MSASSLSHAGAAQNEGSQVGSDPNHSPTMITGMSQAGPVQSDPNASPYVSVHRSTHPYGVPGGPEAYPHAHAHPHHVYVPGPPPHGGPQVPPPEMMYQLESSHPPGGPSQAQPEEEEEEESPPPSVSRATGKRKQPDSATFDTSGKKRRQRAAGAATGEDGEEVPDLEVGPNGGAKHWTEEEKTRFFSWMLTSDEHWEAFRSRMNTVFRECSAELFPNRKSYTALKSCYHRNLEVFKQVHAFQAFSANHYRQMQAENPNAEQPSAEVMLEAARVAGLNVGNLNVKVIDRWYETGWFDLFKKRYREDPKTGLPTAYYGPPDQPSEPGPSSVSQAMMGLHATIDPQLIASHSGQPSQGPNPLQYPSEGGNSQPSVSSIVPNAPFPHSPPSQGSEYRQPGSSTVHQPPVQFTYLRSTSALPPRMPTHRQSTPPPGQGPGMQAPNGQRHSPIHEQHHGENYPGDLHVQIAQALTRFTVVTESLLGVCSSLKELLQQQLEETKARTELLRAGVPGPKGDGDGELGSAKEKEREISIEKVTFATEILKNGPQNEEIKKAAVECLTKYLMRGL